MTLRKIFQAHEQYRLSKNDRKPPKASEFSSVSPFLTCLKCSCLISITATLCTLSQIIDRGRLKLLFIDSDILCYDVKKPDDLYLDFLQDLKYFDTSDYRREHFPIVRETKKC